LAAKTLATQLDLGMSDATDDDDTLDDRLESIQRRAETFRELLKDGDEVTIACDDGEVHVEESYRSKFERKHPKLFGRMLSIEAQMDAGWSAYFAALVFSGVIVMGLHLRWWDRPLGEDLCQYLESWWFYIVLPILLLFLARQGCKVYERFVFRRNRRELLELLAADNLDRDVLLVNLRGDSDVENVVHRLKLDPGPFPAPLPKEEMP
jgi:hypothetical protein